MPRPVKLCLILLSSLMMASCATRPINPADSEINVRTATGYWLGVSSSYDRSQRQRALNIADRVFRQTCSLVEPQVCANPADYFITVGLFGAPGEGCSGVMTTARREGTEVENGSLIQMADFHCERGEQVVIDSYSTQTRIDP